MQIVICGAGLVGTSIAEHLAHENNDVTIIDQNPALVRKISENLDYEVQEVMSQFADREKLKDPLGSSLPQKARQDRKDAYHNAVNQSPDLAAALAIYERFRLRSL